MRILLILFTFFAVTSMAQQVPSRMTVAGVKLHFSDKLREELQKEVDALTISPKYFGIKVERARIYFPIIEKIFSEEEVPDDIKYLVLQESALIPDAVSVSNAVGYWQFKDFTALEVGMRVDKHVDERMHIIAATRGAARYLKKNNTYFDNWIYAIQAYQMGAGGAMKVINKKYEGAKAMDLDHNTYWYVKKYLAHKIAFEHAINGNGEVILDVYERSSNKTLEQIAKETSTDYNQLLAYNVWLRKGSIPDDKIYPVLLPLPHAASHPRPVSSIDRDIDIRKDNPVVIPTRTIKLEQNRFPISGYKKPWFNGEEVRTYNDIPGIIATKDQSLVKLAAMGDVGLSKFLKYNDIDVTHRPKDGSVYYFKRKKAKAGTYYHVVGYDETLWEISQRYGIRIKRLMHKNRLESENEIRPGLVLWLRHVRPESVPAEFKEMPPKVEPARKETPKPVTPVKPIEKIVKADSTSIVEQAVMVEQDSTDIASVQDSVENDTLTITTGTSELEKKDLAIEEETELVEKTDSVEVALETHFINHTIEPGQTLYSLSKQFNVQVVDLLEWNGLKISDKISIGQIVKILQPIYRDAEKEVLDLQDITHEVGAGETLYQISKKYNVTVEELMKWNSKESFNLSTGERLLIKVNNKKEKY